MVHRMNHLWHKKSTVEHSIVRSRGTQSMVPKAKTTAANVPRSVIASA